MILRRWELVRYSQPWRSRSASGVDEAWIVEFYCAMAELAREFRVALAGGDLVRSPVLTVAVTIVGECSARAGLTLRSGARPHDILAVTGSLGASYGGLRLLENPELAKRLELQHGGADRLDARNRERLLAAHLRPRPRGARGAFSRRIRPCARDARHLRRALD